MADETSFEAHKSIAPTCRDRIVVRDPADRDIRVDRCHSAIVSSPVAIRRASAFIRSGSTAGPSCRHGPSNRRSVSAGANVRSVRRTRQGALSPAMISRSRPGCRPDRSRIPSGKGRPPDADIVVKACIPGKMRCTIRTVNPRPSEHTIQAIDGFLKGAIGLVDAKGSGVNTTGPDVADHP